MDNVFFTDKVAVINYRSASLPPHPFGRLGEDRRSHAALEHSHPRRGGHSSLETGVRTSAGRGSLGREVRWRFGDGPCAGNKFETYKLNFWIYIMTLEIATSYSEITAHNENTIRFRLASTFKRHTLNVCLFVCTT